MSDLLDLADGDYDADVRWRGMILEDVGALTAATFPVKPPLDWFDDPKLTAATPLTVENNGRVFGHIAAWHTSHIGIAGGVKPPRSKSNYAFFRTGVVETENGDFVNVGQITLTGGHAPLDASVARTVAHYDNTESAIMDVAAGEDKHGIWVAGALRPDVTDEQVRSIRASSVSGDWRPINGRLELVAVCAVNAPGFPVPRARVAGGAPVALVAAGVEPLIEATLRVQASEDVEAGIQAGLETFRERINHLEAVVIAHGGNAGPLATELADSLREQVHNQERTAVIAALRKRAKGNGDKEEDEEDEDEEVPAKLKKLPPEMRERAMKLRKRAKGVKASADDEAIPLTVSVPAGADAAEIGRAAVEALAASLRMRVKGMDVPLLDPEAEALIAASLRQKMGAFWNPELHPRGRDGQFIEVGGAVSGPVDWYDGRGFQNEGRVRVVDIKPGGELTVEDLSGARRGTARASQMAQVATPQARLVTLEPGSPVPTFTAEMTFEDFARANNLDPDLMVTQRLFEKAYRAYLRRPGGSMAMQSSIDNTFWEDGLAIEASVAQGQTAFLRRRVKGTDPLVATATSAWTAEKRQQAAESGAALPDGSFPIKDCRDVQKAVHAMNRPTKHSNETIRAHIRKRAKALNCEKSLPETWTASAASEDDYALTATAVVGTATSAWTAEKRREAADKGIALPDGSYPIADKTDWMKARQALGRAGPKRGQVIRHLIKRARALGIPKKEYANFSKA